MPGVDKVETFTDPRKFVADPGFGRHKARTLKSLDPSDLDPPVVDIVADFNKLEYCYTLQICYGHFVYQGQPDTHNLDPLPSDPILSEIDYRIAYLALCLANNHAGRALFEALVEIPSIDPDYIQFGSADWFWERHRNSYALQVEPERYKHLDQVTVDYFEARRLEKARIAFFAEIRNLLDNLIAKRAFHSQPKRIK